MKEQKTLFNEGQQEQIRKAKDYNLDEKQIQRIANSDFDWEQMMEIRLGYQNGLTEEQVQMYAKPEYNWRQMHAIRYGFKEYNLSIDQVNLYAKPEFSYEQMKGILQSLYLEEEQQRFQNIESHYIESEEEDEMEM
ncbi:MAG: hypothetical protein SO150_03460 [Faecalicoccus sp.]|uniref:hypothetical protein n=1 Tax=Faecalicoccus sp. TaxID=1971758 RepID=UPI002A81AA5E|nr:hypothetical protein [Faecalicoccus sp.]MDY4869384.1 hypothetical protein [Faecalicoccus sp.]MDY5232741.1 hypothetical protein [Faecalicoccus sp.]